VLTFAVLLLLGGKLEDRFGPKRMFLVGLVTFTLASAACAQATNDAQLIAFRTIQGEQPSSTHSRSRSSSQLSPATSDRRQSESGPASPDSDSRPAR
jgi:hypothetical protein